MDSLLELNNDLRFEHFIDESLDIDMSAVAMLPSLHSEPYYNFVDEILTTGAASRRIKCVSPVLEFASSATHEFLVRFSPEAKKKSPVKDEADEQVQAAPTQPETGVGVVKVELVSGEEAPGATVEAEHEAAHQFLVPPAKKKPPKKSKSLPIEFMCHNCNERFTSHIELEKHYRSHYNTDPVYKCHRCDKQFANLQSFRTHYRRHTTDRLPCTVCPRTFLTQEDLDEHGRTHTTELRLVCSHCQMSFTEFDQYSSHVRSHRNAERKANASPTKWKCPQCGKLLKNRSSLTKHAKIHLEERQYPCSVCPTTFVQKINFINHVKVAHVGDKPYACDECDKCFVGKSQLLRHRQYHISVRAFKCETCSKMYKTERNLKMHSLVHFEQRPHVCTHCGKSFLSSSKLKQHSNVHTGARPYKCKYCAKDFTNFPNWLKHVRRLHKVDHKTGEHLDALPSFLIRAKKPPKVPAAAVVAADGEAASTSIPVEKPIAAAAATTTKRTKAAAKDGGESAAGKAKTAKQKATAAAAAEATANSIDLDDTNARSFEPLPLDLQATSASIQQQCIDMNDVKQIQQLIPANDESFASIEDAHPHSNFAATFIKQESPTFDPTTNELVNRPLSFKFDPATSSSFMTFINQSDMRLSNDTLLLPVLAEPMATSSPFKHSALHPLSSKM